MRVDGLQLLVVELEKDVERVEKCRYDDMDILATLDDKARKTEGHITEVTERLDEIQMTVLRVEKCRHGDVEVIAKIYGITQELDDRLKAHKELMHDTDKRIKELEEKQFKRTTELADQQKFLSDHINRTSTFYCESTQQLIAKNKYLQQQLDSVYSELSERHQQIYMLQTRVSALEKEKK